MIVDETYLDFVREHPCVLCGRPGPSDADHVKEKATKRMSERHWVKPRKCRVCSKEISTDAAGIREHEKTHRDEKRE